MLDVKIEALLMDYALGAASEEVGVLVEAYVERDEGARARLEELRDGGDGEAGDGVGCALWKACSGAPP